MKHTLTLALSILIFAGCAVIEPGQDAVAVRAEQATTLTFEICNNFLLWERSNEALVGKPVHAFAEDLRRQAPGWFTAARTFTKVYKANRTAENKANLLTAIAVLEAAAALGVRGQ